MLRSQSLLHSPSSGARPHPCPYLLFDFQKIIQYDTLVCHLLIQSVSRMAIDVAPDSERHGPGSATLSANGASRLGSVYLAWAGRAHQRTVAGPPFAYSVLSPKTKSSSAGQSPPRDLPEYLSKRATRILVDEDEHYTNALQLNPLPCIYAGEEARYCLPSSPVGGSKLYIRRLNAPSKSRPLRRTGSVLYLIHRFHVAPLVRRRRSEFQKRPYKRHERLKALAAGNHRVTSYTEPKTMPASPSSPSPRLPSPPPIPEVQIGPKSPGMHPTPDASPSEPEDSAKQNQGALRRIRPGTKAADMASGPPPTSLSEVSQSAISKAF